jgi:hypothetical protein
VPRWKTQRATVHGLGESLPTAGRFLGGPARRHDFLLVTGGSWLGREAITTSTMPSMPRSAVDVVACSWTDEDAS